MVLVVAGLEKLDATRAALNGDYVSHVVLDATLAEALLGDAT